MDVDLQPGMLPVRKHGEAVGVSGLHPHALRHACAPHLLRRAGVRHVQELLGHRNLKTTALYTRVSLADLGAVIERCHPRERGRGGRELE